MGNFHDCITRVKYLSQNEFDQTQSNTFEVKYLI